MSQLENLGLLLFKMETVYNTDPTPAAATDPILVGNIKVAPIYEAHQPKPALPYFGEIPNIQIGQGISLSFQTEFRGGGAAATPTKLGMFLRCAGFAQTVATNVDYDETSATDAESGTAYWYAGGKLYKASGLVTKSIKANFEANKPGLFDVEMVGMFAGIAAFATEVSLPSPTFGTLQLPPVLQAAAFAIDGYSALISKLALSVENTVTPRKDASATYGINRYIVTDRKITGSCDPEMVALSTYNPWTTFDNGTAGALTITLGSATGNKLVVSSSRVLKSKVDLGARDGIKVYELGFDCTVTTAAGNDRLHFKTQ